MSIIVDNNNEITNSNNQITNKFQKTITKKNQKNVLIIKILI